MEAGWEEEEEEDESMGEMLPIFGFDEKLW